MDTYYPAGPIEVRHVGYLARHIRRLPPPAPLSSSFASDVRKMVNRGPNRPLKRRQDNWQEDWMEEDDLLEEEEICAVSYREVKEIWGKVFKGGE